MSMLSVQIDRLRSCADLYDGTAKPEMAKELQRPYLAQELREAADTIWQLRDDLQRANAENAKLRELLAEICTIAECLCNAVTDGMDWDCDQCCPFHEGNRRKRCKLGELQVRLHELGIEVQQ